MSIRNSALFLTIARDTISETLHEGNVEDVIAAKSWVLNEATDFEIMSLLVLGESPEDPFDIVAEQDLWDGFKKVLFQRYNSLSEIVGKETLEDMVLENGPISSYGVSTAAPIMEAFITEGFLLEAPPSFQKDVIEKTGKDIAGYIKNAYKFYTKGKGGEAIQGGMKKAVKAAEKKFGKGPVEKALGGAEKYARATQDIAKGSVDTAKQYAKTAQKFYSPTGKGGQGLQKGMEKLSKKAQDIKGGITGDTAKQLAKSRETSSKLVGQLGKARSQTGYKLWAAAEKGLRDLGDKSGASGVAKAINQKFGTDIGSAGAGAAAGVAALAVAAMLTYGAYKTYQRFMSKAAKACAGKGGAEKTACMKTFKQNAIKAQMSDLSKSMGGCKSAKNPAKCQAAIQKKIQKLKVKLAKAGG